MTDIVERLRNSCSCNFPDTPCGAEDECRAAFDAADEIERLREWNAEIALNAREFAAENERLRAENDKARARGDRMRMALEDIAYGNPLHNEDNLMHIARTILEEPK